MLLCISTGCTDTSHKDDLNAARVVITSDTILSGMISSLLPERKYSIEAILPPGQCPGHYDVKLSDIEKLKNAYLVVSFVGMPFMSKTSASGRFQILVDAEGRNFMSPDSYVFGLNTIAEKLLRYFPEDSDTIVKRKRKAIAGINEGAGLIHKRIKKAGISGMTVIASSMQRQPLEWMGLRVVATYGRQEAMSAKEIVRLLEVGKSEKVRMVVDNLQSGPDAGKSIAEGLNVPHVVLSNFPSEKGYLTTLEENAEAVIKAAMLK